MTWKIEINWREERTQIEVGIRKGIKMIRGIERERNKMTLIRRGEEKKEGRRGKNKIVEKGGKGIVKKI